VIFGDLDGFKLINDSLGHHVGDRILSETLPRLQRELRAGDTLSRFGGDEFVVVCDDVTEPDAVCRVAQRLLDAISRPVSIDGADHVLTASLGIAVGTAEHDAATVVRDADAAMYEAKRRGRNRFELFDRRCTTGR
jgi:diguanylate cyclase (GGDEF)-like protein